MQTRRATTGTNGKQRKSKRGKSINLNVRMLIASTAYVEIFAKLYKIFLPSPATFVVEKCGKGCHIMLYATITLDIIVSPLISPGESLHILYA